ncbi:hypothetical protein LEN26_005830 [Aphanomyces euteiches]|nr:hypothetical protein LEN26_005830 [Aphanomyces euteiches]
MQRATVWSATQLFHSSRRYQSQRMLFAESSLRGSWEVPVFLPWKTAEFLPPLTKPHRGKKQVVFTTATTFVFPLEYGGSAIPSDHGPPIGLAKTHTRQECHDLDYICPRRGIPRQRVWDTRSRGIRLIKLIANESQP